jgi:prepilin-type N-terminal cleavage/methylation domain-containing protein
MNKKNGFTLVELMVVVAIIALLSLVAVPRYWHFQAKAKRAEVYLNLSALHTAEKLYWADNGKYTNKILGEDSIDWRTDRQPNYTYGFAGVADVNYILGKLGKDASILSGHANVGENSFTAAAVADIDGDGEFDVITINENGEIKIVKNDLA